MTLPLNQVPYDRPDWEPYGLCRQVDPELFFPADEDKGVKQRRAREFCAVCPALEQCRNWAMEFRPEGIWGGTSTKERQKLRKRRSRAHCPVCVSTDVVRVEDPAPKETCISCGASWNADSQSTQHNGRPAVGRAAGEVIDLPLLESEDLDALDMTA